MSKKFIQFVATLFVVFSLLAAAVPALALTTRTARGTVIALNKRTHVMTIKNSLGNRVKLKYNSNTVIRINSRKVSITRLHVGDRLVMNYSPVSGSVSGTALDGDDSPGAYELSGIVSLADPAAGVVDIASSDGGSIVTLKVDASTVITRNGAPATLADLMFGDKVDARYASGSMLASSIKAESDVSSEEFEGVVSALDPATGDVTITPESGADVTIHTNSSTFFMYNDSPGVFGNMQVGMEIEARFDAASLFASYVEFQSAGY